MWLGRSSPSCTISSARSVSHAAIPCAARCSLRSISAVAIDLTLTTSSTPCALATSATTADASAASRAQCTVAPARGQRLLEPQQVLVEVQQGVVLDRGAGQPQLLPVVDLGDDVGALGPDRRGRVREVARAAGCRPAPPAPRPGTAGIPTNVAVIGASVAARHLGQVHHPYAGPLPREQPADVHQAGVVAGDQHLGAGLPDVPRLVRPHRHRRVGVLHRERAAEAAALARRRGRSTSRRPRTARSSRVGRSPTPSIRSEWQVGW